MITVKLNNGRVTHEGREYSNGKGYYVGCGAKKHGDRGRLTKVDGPVTCKKCLKRMEEEQEPKQEAPKEMSLKEQLKYMVENKVSFEIQKDNGKKIASGENKRVRKTR